MKAKLRVTIDEELIPVNFVLPDMIAKSLGGMPARRALAWAEDQVR